MGGKVWSPAEEQLIRQLYGRVPARAIAERLPGRTRGAIASHAFVLGLKAGRSGRLGGIAIHRNGGLFGCTCRKSSRCWRSIELDLLESKYGVWAVEKIARKLGRSVTAVHCKAARLKIRHSAEAPVA